MTLALLLAAACSGDCRAQALFQTMERTLLSAQPALQVEAVSRADGSVKADATSDISVGPMVRFHTSGQFMGAPFTKDFDQPSTPELREAVLLGLSRMGALHNAVNVSQGNGIDRARVEAVNFKRAKGGVSYSVQVNGKITGESTLSIDAKTKRPLKRSMVVHFPNGEMRVTETYKFPVLK